MINTKKLSYKKWSKTKIRKNRQRCLIVPPLFLTVMNIKARRFEKSQGIQGEKSLLYISGTSRKAIKITKQF